MIIYQWRLVMGDWASPWSETSEANFNNMLKNKFFGPGLSPKSEYQGRHIQIHEATILTYPTKEA